MQYQQCHSDLRAVVVSMQLGVHAGVTGVEISIAVLGRALSGQLYKQQQYCDQGQFCIGQFRGKF